MVWGLVSHSSFSIYSMAGFECLVFLLGWDYSLYNTENAVGFKYLRVFPGSKNFIYTHPHNFSLNYITNHLISNYLLYTEEIYFRQFRNDGYKGDKQKNRLLLLKACNWIGRFFQWLPVCCSFSARHKASVSIVKHIARLIFLVSPFRKFSAQTNNFDCAKYHTQHHYGSSGTFFENSELLLQNERHKN
jgi:hypothetical protein